MHALDTQGELPTVAVVVHVAQHIARLVQRLVETDVGDRRARVLTFFDVVRAEEQFAPRVKGAAAERESVQVIVQPAERSLQGAMDIQERDVGAQVEAAPDRWPRAVEVDAYAEDDGLLEFLLAQARIRRK